MAASLITVAGAGAGVAWPTVAVAAIASRWRCDERRSAPAADAKGGSPLVLCGALLSALFERCETVPFWRDGKATWSSLFAGHRANFTNNTNDRHG